MRILALVLAGVFASSCGKGTSSPTAAAVGQEVGTYALQTLDGKAVPTTINDGGTLVEVNAGTLILGAGNTLQMSTTARASGTATWQTMALTGSYRVQGSTLSFSYSNGGANSGTLNGTTLQMTNEGVLWSYRRQ